MFPALYRHLATQWFKTLGLVLSWIMHTLNLAFILSTIIWYDLKISFVFVYLYSLLKHDQLKLNSKIPCYNNGYNIKFEYNFLFLLVEIINKIVMSTLIKILFLQNYINNFDAYFLVISWKIIQRNHPQTSMKVYECWWKQK